MHTFKVVRGECGWTVKLGEAAIAPCRSQFTAVSEAQRMAEALRAKGEAVAIVIERDQNVLQLAAPIAAASAYVWASRRELRSR